MTVMAPINVSVTKNAVELQSPYVRACRTEDTEERWGDEKYAANSILVQRETAHNRKGTARSVAGGAL